MVSRYRRYRDLSQFRPANAGFNFLLWLNRKTMVYDFWSTSSPGRFTRLIFGDFDSYFFVVERNVYFTESSEYVIPPPGPSPFFMFSLLILCSFFPGGVSTVVAMFYSETNKTVFSGTKVVWKGILCLIFIAV